MWIKRARKGGDGEAKTGLGKDNPETLDIQYKNAVFIICKIVESGIVIPFLHFGKNSES